MKKIILFIILTTSLISCSEFLEEDPKGRLSPDNFSTLSDLDQATISLYPLMNTMFNEVACYAPLFGGDDVTTVNAGNKIPFLEFCIFNPTAFNTRYSNMWYNGYATIKSANAIILNYEGVDELEEVKQNWAGQAYFMRALAYYFIVRVWGDIPKITNLDVNYEIEKSNPAEIYDLIISDLKTAESFLPDSWDKYSKDYPEKAGVCPTSGSAKSLLASVYLTTAGWPLHKTENYALAATKAKEVIDGANSGIYNYGLLPDYGQLWRPENQFNDEIVFGAFFNLEAVGTHWGNSNMLGPQAGAPSDEGGWNDYMGEIAFFNKFPGGPRKDATYQTVLYKGSDTLLWSDPATDNGHPYFKKYNLSAWYDSLTHKTTNWICDRTVYIIRYSQVLLVYAEAQAMANNAPDNSAYDAINAVRKRAGLPNLTTGLSATAFQDSVVAERGWEFAGLEPCSRWFDLQRMEMVKEANDPVARTANGEQEIIGDPDEHYYAPIPNGEQLVNDNI